MKTIGRERFMGTCNGLSVWVRETAEGGATKAEIEMRDSAGASLSHFHYGESFVWAVWTATRMLQGLSTAAKAWGLPHKIQRADDAPTAPPSNDG